MPPRLLRIPALRYKPWMRWRVTAFVAVIFGVFTVLVWAGWMAWETADQIASQLSRDRMQTLRMGDTFGADIHELRSHFRRYEASREGLHWAQFIVDARRITERINEEGRLASGREAEAVSSLRRNLDTYVLASSKVHARLEAGASRDDLARTFAELGDMASDMAVDLRQMVSLRQSVLEANLAAARSRFARLVSIAAASFWLAVVLIIVLATLVWSGLVRSLQRRLMASEDVARRSEKLASLGILAAGLAHEVRNPLTAIKARLFIQQRRLPAHSPALEDARIINREINRLEGIVRTVLAFARPTPPEPVEVDPARVLDQVRQLVLEDCARQDIRIHLDSAPQLAFRADAAQVHQVILNLVQNAVEAVGRGGNIHLSARNAMRRFGDHLQPGVVIQIQDDGPGIPPAVQERLFDPFFTTKPEGTGLGLAISARIVEGNGGLLEFASEAGRGTLFAVAFPAVP